MTEPLIDDSALFMDVSPVCDFCARHVAFSKICEAFPGGIPDEIWSGENAHSESFDGDHGLRFEPAFPGAHPLDAETGATS